MKPFYSYWNLALALSFCSLGLVGCGSGNSKDESSSESYKYSLNDNGCKTEKALSSKQSYCDTLEDATANNGCALGDRKRLYQRDCGTDFRETNPLNP